MNQTASLDLVKGQKVDITKGNNVTEINVGLSWNSSKGAQTLDADAFAICLGNDGKLYHHDEKQAVLCFNAPSTNNPANPKERGIIPVDSTWALIHSGDELTGAAEGDDETMKVNFTKVPNEVNQVLFFANIYQAKEKNQNFGQADQLSIRAYGPGLPQEIKYDLSENHSTSICILFGKVYRYEGDWKFEAIERAVEAKGINEAIQQYM